jgi:hypothetical protein
MAKTFTIEVTDEEARAFELIVTDPDAWVDNAVRNKVRKCLIYVTEKVSQNTAGLLSPADLAEIEADMLAAGDVMKAPKHYSKAVKEKIAARTTMQTRTERDAAEVEAMEPK